jgi:hypothetical protein
MNSNAAVLVRASVRRAAPHGAWGRCAPWVAPLLTAAVLALATFVMFASSGAALI